MRLQVDDVCHQNNWGNVWNGNWIRKSIHEINEINLLRKVICEHNSSFEEPSRKKNTAHFSRTINGVCVNRRLGREWSLRANSSEREQKWRKKEKEPEKSRRYQKKVRQKNSIRMPAFHWAVKYNSNQLIRWRTDPTELMIMNIECA